MRVSLPVLALLLVPACSFAGAALGSMHGSMEVRWDAGAQTCGPAHTTPPLQVHRYNAQTYVLRENLCSTWEAPFIYLLVGSKQALLIDTGDIAEAKAMPLRETVMGLLPSIAGATMPLIVVHSHGHLDHRTGDPQFENIAGVQRVPADLDHVRGYFGFTAWPAGTAQIDLGERIIDVLPAPGHHPAHLLYYDRDSGILFSGDYLLPGRLLVDDLAAYRASAQRVADFIKDRPVTYVLGGHIEKNTAGELLPSQSTYHPDEHVLQLTKADVLALPAALREFNGWYLRTGDFVIESPLRILLAVAFVAFIVLAVFAVLLYRFIRRKRALRHD
jgi:hydroxyacylglutathione hydrolase